MADDQWARVAEILHDFGFPGSKFDIVKHARIRQADEATLGLLAGLPVTVYRNLADVRTAVSRDPAA
jgi:Protein of unknown function (DUF2795)